MYEHVVTGFKGDPVPLSRSKPRTGNPRKHTQAQSRTQEAEGERAELDKARLVLQFAACGCA